MAAALYPKHVTDQVFAIGGKFRTASALAPRRAKTRRVAGGYVILDGLWMYNSGVYHAHWNQLGIPLVDDSGHPIGLGAALIPTTDVTFLNDWDAIGLRGSGSRSVTVKDVFVPDERIALSSRNLQDDYASAHLRDVPAYRMPMVALLPVRLICSIIGMARAALEIFMDKIGARGIAFTTYDKQDEAAITHLQIGEASAKIDAAQSIVRQSIRTLDEGASSGVRLTSRQRAQIWRDCGFSSKLLWEAVDMLAGPSGTEFINRGAPINPVWHHLPLPSIHPPLFPTPLPHIFS